MNIRSITRPNWQISLQNLFTRFTRLEYLPIYIINIPVFLFYLNFALRARHPLFFTATNPDIHTGGLFGENKYYILRKLDERYIPNTLPVVPGQPFEEVQSRLKSSGLHRYPLIAKPSVGERGAGVRKLESEKALQDYHIKMNAPYLIQEYIDWPQEFSVLYVREPGRSEGKITSLCHKLPLTVTGDGKSTLVRLIIAKERARLQWPRLKEKFRDQLDHIPEKDEEIMLEVIGNHSRGSTFRNINHLIDIPLENAFNKLMAHDKDLCFIRFDLKCHSLERLKELRDFSVVEINGVGAEPAHVYDPDNTATKFYRDMYRHWKTIYTIARANHSRGIPYMSLYEGFRAFWNYRTQIRKTLP